MANARVARGRRTNVIVAKWLTEHGWPEALATFGSEPGKDVKHVPGYSIEVKARTRFNPLEWLKQAKSYAAEDDRPCVILRCNGQGEAAGDYLVIRRLEDDELNRSSRGVKLIKLKCKTVNRKSVSPLRRRP
jgi:hypothetical protein